MTNSVNPGMVQFDDDGDHQRLIFSRAGARSAGESDVSFLD